MTNLDKYQTGQRNRTASEILRTQKIFIGLDSFSNQCLIYLAPFRYTSLCIDYPVESCKISVILFCSMLPNLKGH